MSRRQEKNTNQEVIKLCASFPLRTSTEHFRSKACIVTEISKLKNNSVKNGVKCIFSEKKKTQSYYLRYSQMKKEIIC